ncbi:MAG: glycosyltransferase family 1 protein [Chlamydiales bacterium]|nr:glycosyltransferase family 1 protein [Chlamydiales bacterium]
MKIDFLVGENAYGTTFHFAKAFSEALQRQGANTRLHWIGDGSFFHAFHEITREPPDLTCSFSDVHLSGRPLGNLWQIPHLSLLIDPAIYFLHQLRGEYSWVSCADEGDVDFVRRLNFERVLYLPHGGDRSLLTPPGKERPFEVVFFGSCVEQTPNDERVVAASERVLSPEGVTILDALIDLGVSDELLPRYHAEVDLYTRFLDRISLLGALKSHEVHIWGSGPWKKYLPNAIVHAPIPFERTLEIMKQAKVVVNSSPRFKRGLHERILYAPLCGAAVLSAHEGGYRYRYGEWEDQAFDDWEEIALDLQAEILAEHTWDHRAQTLLHQLCKKKRNSSKFINKILT